MMAIPPWGVGVSHWGRPTGHYSIARLNGVGGWFWVAWADAGNLSEPHAFGTAVSYIDAEDAVLQKFPRAILLPDGSYAAKSLALRRGLSPANFFDEDMGPLKDEADWGRSPGFFSVCFVRSVARYFWVAWRWPFAQKRPDAWGHAPSWLEAEDAAMAKIDGCRRLPDVGFGAAESWVEDLGPRVRIVEVRDGSPVEGPELAARMAAREFVACVLRYPERGEISTSMIIKNVDGSKACALRSAYSKEELRSLIGECYRNEWASASGGQAPSEDLVRGFTDELMRAKFAGFAFRR